MTGKIYRPDEIGRALGNIEGQLTHMNKTIQDMHDAQTKRLNDHTERLSGLEKSRAWQKGRDGVLGLILSAAGVYWLQQHIGMWFKS